jgi:hypothetical protein
MVYGGVVVVSVVERSLVCLVVVGSGGCGVVVNQNLKLLCDVIYECTQLSMYSVIKVEKMH